MFKEMKPRASVADQNHLGGCRISIKRRAALDEFKQMLPELAAELENISVEFDKIKDDVNKLPEGKQKTQANKLMITLLAHKETYFNSDIDDGAAKGRFLKTCRDSIVAESHNLKAHVGLLKSFANFFINLVNLVLPKRYKISLFEPKQTEAQSLINEFNLKLEAILGISKDDEQASEESNQRTNFTVKAIS